MFMNNMGLLIAKSGKDERAIVMYERALKHAANDPSVADLRIACLGNIAMSYRALKDLAKAEDYASKAVEEAKQAIGTENPDYGFVLAQQGVILLDDHKYEDAKESLSESIAILEKSLGNDNPQLAGIKKSYAKC